ncbi:Uncharacterised protein [Mycobacteroides abscessus subsp. abscessus]|nr:Uncharacterised protein [Mycobacteroides abscessus subsp. abscessus]
MLDVPGAHCRTVELPHAAVTGSFWIGVRAAKGIGRVDGNFRIVEVVAHRPLLGIGVHRCGARRIRRQLRIVGADAVSVCVRIGEHPAQQHLVRRKTDPGHDIRRLERRLLNFHEVVARVAVERPLADLDQRVVLL